MLDNRLELFVYGTLKRGQANHALFCRGAAHAEPAASCGTLFDLPAGYPALAVPADLVLATGSADLEADLALQRESQQRLDSSAAPTAALKHHHGAEAAEVQGEWLVFEDGVARLRRLDRFERFRPGEAGLFERVLIPVRLSATQRIRAAWAYVQTAPQGTALPHGSWPS